VGSTVALGDKHFRIRRLDVRCESGTLPAKTVEWATGIERWRHEPMIGNARCRAQRIDARGAEAVTQRFMCGQAA
jgi:hypothetical protein